MGKPGFVKLEPGTQVVVAWPKIGERGFNGGKPGDTGVLRVSAMNGSVIGWIDPSCLELTPEGQAAKGAEILRQSDLAQKRRDELAVKLAAEETKDAKLQATCSSLYRLTVDRKVSDLTVRESQQIKACEDLGMYHKK